MKILGIDPGYGITGFGLIDAWEILRASRGGRMVLVTVTLSDWIYRSVLSKSVLTLSRSASTSRTSMPASRAAATSSSARPGAASVTVSKKWPDSGERPSSSPAPATARAALCTPRAIRCRPSRP